MDPQVDDQFERQFFSYVLDRVVPASATGSEPAADFVGCRFRVVVGSRFAHQWFA